MSRFRWRTAFVGLLFAGGIGFGIASFGLSNRLVGDNSTGIIRADAPPIATPHDLSVAFRQVAENVLPAIVTIETVQTSAVAASQIPQLPDDPLFRRFFGDEFGDRFQQLQPQQRQQRGQGSGFVIDAKGVVLTNSHVVEGADKVTLRFQDGQEIVATEWKNDPWTDIAIVRFTPVNPVQAISLGDSNHVEIGDWVLAFGDPFGVGTSMTAGIISGKGRAPHINDREEYLQTDAAINPGNSGGPLVNLQGEVIGINTAISSRSGGYDGVGFAIPSQLVRWVSDQLIQHGRVARPYLGVAAQPLTQELRQKFGIGIGEGALVSQTFPGSPAQTGGILSGDVILQVNGQQVVDGGNLQGIVERLEVGKTYPVLVIRGGEKQTLNITLAEMPGNFARNSAASESPSAPQNPVAPSVTEKYGMEVIELTAQNRQSLGLKGDVQGVVVAAVVAGGPADNAGISKGNVIQRVGTTSIQGIDDFTKAVSMADADDGILMHIRSANGSRFVVLHPNKE